MCYRKEKDIGIIEKRRIQGYRKEKDTGVIEQGRI